VSRKAAGHALKAVAFLLAPFPFGLAVATIRGWSGLTASGRLLAGWMMLIAFSVALPLFLRRAGRAVLGHESARLDRRLLWTGLASLALAVAAAVTVPWRELTAWLVSTLTDLTGFSVPVPANGR
jgi:hypothetical protein